MGGTYFEHSLKRKYELYSDDGLPLPEIIEALLRAEVDQEGEYGLCVHTDSERKAFHRYVDKLLL